MSISDAATNPGQAPAANSRQAFGPWTWSSRSWWLGLLFTLALTAWAWLPWLSPHLIVWRRDGGPDDAKNHLLRLYVLGWLLQHGEWYPRWVPDLFMGWGYPVFNYYAPAFYYLALLNQAVLRLDTWDGYRAAGVEAALLGAAGAYALTAAVWRRPALGVLAALTLLYGPYVFQLNLYKRGDIPEALGLALLPWLLLALWRLWTAPTAAQQVAWVIGAAAAGAAVILVHTLTSFLAAALAAVWVTYLFVTQPTKPARTSALRQTGNENPHHFGLQTSDPSASSGQAFGLRTRSRLLAVALAGALAAGASAFFWLPAVSEAGAAQLEWVRDTPLDYSSWFLNPAGHSLGQDSPENRQSHRGWLDLHLHYPHQLVAPPMASLAQAGLAATIALSAAVALARRRPAGPLVPLLVFGLICWLLTFTISAPIWRLLPGLPLLQFPWRLLGPLGICIAVAGAGAFALPLAALEARWGARGRVAGWALVTLAGGAVLFNSVGDRQFPYAEQPPRTVDGQSLLTDEMQDNLSMGTTSGREFLPRDFSLPTYTRGAPRGRDVIEHLYPESDWLGSLLSPMAGDLRFVDWRVAPLALSVRVANDAAQPGALAVRQLRFPGWRAWVDGRRVPVGVASYIPAQQAAMGFMVVQVPPGEHTIRLEFGPTPPRVIGTAISLASLLAVAGAGLWLLRRAPRSHPNSLPGGQTDHGRYRTLRLRPSPVALGSVAFLAAAGLGALAYRQVRPLLAPPATSVPGPHVVHGVWAAPDLTASGAGLLVNLAEAVRAGQGAVDSPSGSALGPAQFVDVRQLTVTDADQSRGPAGTSRREWLYLHPPSTVSVDVALPPRRQVWLQAALALDPATWDAPVGDGVEFVARVAPLNAGGQAGPATIVVDETSNPRARTEDRRWMPLEADLSPWAGTTVRLTLQTLPRDDTAFDWAGLGNPVVVVEDTPRAHPPAPDQR